MSFETILTETRGATLIITINRPQAMNALNTTVLSELEQAVQELLRNDALKGAVIRGAGEKAFVAGADIAGINALPGEEAEAFSKKGQQIFASIENSPKPVIAAVNGFALGGGCELAMACHMRVATEKAKFGQPEVNLGLVAGYGGTQRLPRLVGLGKAVELLLTADMVPAQQALELGLANHVVEGTDATEKSIEILEKIYTKSPLAVALTLRSIYAGVNDPSKGYADEAKSFGQSVGSADGREGTQAFLEKRKANFTGK